MDFKKILFKTSAIDVEKSLPDALVFVSKEGKIQWVNDIAADILETSKIHLMTSNISDFIEKHSLLDKVNISFKKYDNTFDYYSIQNKSTILDE
jgi:nitrogen-specific signal transduction histidine kinase